MKFFLRYAIAALALLIASPAWAVCGTGAGQCFWVGGTGTWDTSTTTHWASSTGGAGSVAVPISTSPVVFDAASGGGTVTVDTSISGSTFASITMGVFAGTFDNSINANFTLTSFSNSGTGTRIPNLGSGSTWTITGPSGTVWDMAIITSMGTWTAPSVVTVSATAIGQRLFNAAVSKAFNTLNFTDTGTGGYNIDLSAGNAFTVSTAWNITGVRAIKMASNQTITIGGTMTWDQTSTTQGVLYGTSSTTTLSVANATTLSWLTLNGITKSGAGSLTVNNGIDAGNNHSVTINPPASGGGGYIIGG